MWIFFVIFLLLMPGSILIERDIRNYYVFAFFAFILALFAGLRSDIDNDYNSYVKTFETIESICQYFTEYQKNASLEPFYYFIPALFSSLGIQSYLAVFIVFALLGVGSKFYAIFKLSNTIGLSILIYFSYFFILHEMTQIRSGVAAGILLISLKYAFEKKPAKFVMLVALATCFHYSSLIFLPLYFLDGSKLNKKLWVIILTLPFALYFAKLDFISLISIFSFGVFAEKLKAYQTMFELGTYAEPVNIFNVKILLQMVMVSLFLWYSDLLILKNRYSILLTKCLILSLCFFVLFSPLPVFAFRIQELFGIAQIIAYPFILYLFKEKYFAMFMVILLALLTLLFNLYYLQLLQPYF